MKNNHCPSHLARVLEAGVFAVAAELSPPRGVNLEAIERDANILRGYADAVNVTDNQAASVRMSSSAVSALLIQHGVRQAIHHVVKQLVALGRLERSAN